MVKYLLTALHIILFFNLSVLAQKAEDEEDIDWSKRLIEEVKLENPVYKPIISLGIGAMNFYGDIKNSNLSDPFAGNQTFSVDILRTMNPQYSFGFRFLYGNLSANDYQKHLNFKSQILTFGANVSYNFGHIKFFSDNEKKVINPFITLGLEFLNFDSNGDIKDANDRIYYYWNDGTIRDLPESPENVGRSVTLQRNFDYESSNSVYNTDKQDLSQISIGIPIDMGLQFTMSQKASIKVGYSHHFTFVDNIDDITENSTGIDQYNRNRTGDSHNDQFGYSYISFTLDLFSRTTEDRQLQFLDLGAGGIFDFWDMDGDFVMDIFDQCPYTPFGQLVDTSGCPLDDDIDGVANYRDKEENTSAKAFYVDTVGKEITEPIMLAKLNNNESLLQPKIYDYYPSLLDGTGLYRRFYKTIPEKFKAIDQDKDDYISLDELILSIDTFFEGNTDLTVDDLYELNEFFFIQ